MEDKYAKQKGNRESRLELNAPQLAVAELFLNEDREQLYLNAAAEALKQNSQSPKYYTPVETHVNVANLLSSRDCMLEILKGLERDLQKINNGAKIHEIPSLVSGIKGYRGFIENGLLPSDPVELAVYYEKQFGRMFSILCRARHKFDLKI